MSAAPTAEERAWQDRLGGRLQERAYARAGTRLVLDGQHARIAAALDPGPAMRVLDLGCGVGHLLAWLERRAPGRYDGLDLSPASLRAARDTAGVERLVAGDATRLPFRDGSYDRVVCNGSAHHLPDLDAAMREVHRVLRPRGRLVLYEPVDSPVTGAIRHTLFRWSPWESPADVAHKDAFTPATVAAALRAAGFTDVVTTAHDFLAYPLSGMYMALPWSRSRGAMRALLAVERRLGGVAPLRPLWNALSWRVCFIATRPA